MSDTKLQTATHIVGPHVIMQYRCIQRCCVCGLKILDIRIADHRIKELQPNEMYLISTYAPGTLLQEREDPETGLTKFTPVPADLLVDGVIPDSCMALVES